MSFITKPKGAHPGLPRNDLGLTYRAYEGGMSTLCAGCGHDSVTAAMIQACFELSLSPQSVVKLSGIGCSSKSTAYFISGAHGFNSVHGRMPAIASGAGAANRALNIIGVSGDGDSLSIGLGQLGHVVRRNLNMLYMLENNGVYGLTKGQFSASADIGSKSKKGESNEFGPIDPVLLALSLGAGFVARSFSGDKAQLVPLIKAALAHPGFALIDVISPCVTFNDHDGSTKSYSYMKDHDEPIHEISFVPSFDEIAADYEPGSAYDVRMHDGSTLRLRKIDDSYDPRNKVAALTRIAEATGRDEVLTGVLYVAPAAPTFLETLNLTEAPLGTLPQAITRPPREVLAKIMEEYR